MNFVTFLWTRLAARLLLTKMLQSSAYRTKRKPRFVNSLSNSFSNLATQRNHNPKPLPKKRGLFSKKINLLFKIYIVYEILPKVNNYSLNFSNTTRISLNFSVISKFSYKPIKVWTILILVLFNLYAFS